MTPKMIAELLAKYGLPTAFLAVVSAFAFWLVKASVLDNAEAIEALAEEIDHLARLVDLTCRQR